MMYSLSSTNSCKAAPSTNEALPSEQNTITYSERHDAPRLAHSSISAMQYTTADSSHNNNVHANNTHSLTSRGSTTQLGHPLHETLPLTQQALALHDTIHTSVDADKSTQYSAEQAYGPGTDRAYMVGERACVLDEHHAIQGGYFGLHEHSHISATHVINHPQATPLGINHLLPPTEAGMNDHLPPYPRQVNFGHEERVVQHMQDHDWTSVSNNFHGIGAQFEFLSL